MEIEEHLWEMDTAWFQPQANEFMNQTFYYKSWKEFTDCKPYHIWKPYVLSSWAWKDDKLQLVFISPERFIGMNRAEIFVKKEDEESIKAWIKSHMPKFWKL
jgi:hypothetical protein